MRYVKGFLVGAITLLIQFVLLAVGAYNVVHGWGGDVFLFLLGLFQLGLGLAIVLVVGSDVYEGMTDRVRASKHSGPDAWD